MLSRVGIIVDLNRRHVYAAFVLTKRCTHVVFDMNASEKVDALMQSYPRSMLKILTIRGRESAMD